MSEVKIPYVNRSAAQIKEYVLTRIFGSRDVNGNFVAGEGLVPEMTDHSDNNLLVRIINIWAGIAEMLGFYIDVAAKETFLQTCRRYRSAALIARFYDYRIKCRTAASVGMTFYLNAAHSADITIPMLTQVKNEDSISFLTTEDLVIAAGQTRGTVIARNAVSMPYEILVTSTGLANQEYQIPATAMYNSASLRVNGIIYTSVDTFAFSKSTDTHFIETVDESGTPVVRFGDGVLGFIPVASALIELSYQATDGSVGNIASAQINTIASTLTLPTGIVLTCTNLLSAAGGTEIETLKQLKRRIPMSNRTKMRAVTQQDFIDIAQTYPSVARAGVTTQCGAAIQLYIVPLGGGIASELLLNDVAAYFDDKKVFGRLLQVQPTGEVTVKLVLQIKARADYSQVSVFDAVKARLVSFGSYENQAISGRVELSDIFEIIENTEGVVASKIITMTTQPFARPVGVWQTLDWTPITLVGSNQTVQWRMEFVTIHTFQLFRNNVYVGTHTVGAQVTKTEIQFTVNDDYDIGTRFTFVTYAYYGTIQLSEPSLPVIQLGDISIGAYS